MSGMFFWDTVYINVISDLFRLIEKIKMFNFNLHSSNVIVIIRYY